GERDVQPFHAPRACALRRLHPLAPSRPQRREARFLHHVEADAHDHPQSTLPPFTLRISPVMCPARSEQRNTIGPAQSSGLAKRPSGIVRSMSSLPRPASLAYGVADISVSTHPGATQFTLIRRGASSTARHLV